VISQTTIAMRPVEELLWLMKNVYFRKQKRNPKSSSKPFERRRSEGTV